MNINTLLNALVNAIATDADLTAWCNTTYGRQHKVFVNIDKRNPPGEEDCPFVIIFPIQKRVGRGGVGQKLHGFEADCCIYNEDSGTPTEPNVLWCTGVTEIEAFRKKVETAIANINISNILLETIDIEYEVIESFPFLWAGMTLIITETVTIGSDPLE
jgi:hypothetical protein